MLPWADLDRHGGCTYYGTERATQRILAQMSQRIPTSRRSNQNMATSTMNVKPLADRILVRRLEEKEEKRGAVSAVIAKAIKRLGRK